MSPEQINPGDGGVGYSWFAIELTSDHVPEAVAPKAFGDASPQFVGMPITGDDFELRWSSEFDSRLPVLDLLQVNGSLSLVRSVTASMHGFVSATRNIELIVSGERLEATRWNKLIREDEELLLSI